MSLSIPLVSKLTWLMLLTSVLHQKSDVVYAHILVVATLFLMFCLGMWNLTP